MPSEPFYTDKYEWEGEYSAFLNALRDQEFERNALTRTAFEAEKTANQDIQFALDPSFGLTRERYGWYSNDVLFDGTFFSEVNGQIEIETGATGTDSARIRSAYPGQYFSHTIAEPSVGVQIPEEHLEYDTSGEGETVSLTHGEISAEIVEWDDATDSGVNAHGLSFESDGVYVQIRKNDQNVAFVRQENWNIDPLDGTGPSEHVLRPENGYIYSFPFTWYGHGSLWVAVQDPTDNTLLPVHREKLDGGVSIGTPNLPVQVTVENQGTADPLGASVGGMSFTTFGSASFDRNEAGRQTEITRWTGSSYIDLEATLSDDEIDPFAQAGRPLVSMRRDPAELDSRVALSVDITRAFVNSGGNLFIAVFDEFDPANALTGANFRDPNNQQNSRETRLEVDTSATAYTPGPNAVLRTLLFVAGDKNTAEVISGESSSRLPLEATAVVTAILPPGANSTYAQPLLLNVREGY